MTTAHCEWGPNGILALRNRVKVLVIVDVLSFSTSVDIAVSRGATIIPFPAGDDAAARHAAKARGALLAGHRHDGGYSLSPASLEALPAGAKLVMPSPNGSRLSLAGADAIMFAGCLRNRTAVAAAVRLAAGSGDIAVIPAGERWKSDDSLRPAIEDWIGAGAILDALDGPMTAEARVARDAFRSARPDLSALLHESMSGRELIDRGFPRDVDLAAELDVSTSAPRLRDGVYAS